MHPLKSIPAFVKRDDELGFNATGSKLRKYISVLPFLMKQDVDEILVLGTSHSNNILGLSQLLIENNLPFKLFLLKSHKPESDIVGNELLIRHLVDDSKIHWYSRDEQIEEILSKYQQLNSSKKMVILNEGADHPSALAGCLTLVEDIKRNEQELGIEFDHIFLDCGTGVMGSSAIVGLSYLQCTKTTLHIIQLSGRNFLATLERYKKYFEEQFHENLDQLVPFELHKPKLYQSFGSTSNKLFRDLQQFSRTEGFFTDPIYSFKAFSTAKAVIEERNLKGNILIVHSGGINTLAGFQHQLRNALKL